MARKTGGSSGLCVETRSILIVSSAARLSVRVSELVELLISRRSHRRTL